MKNQKCNMLYGFAVSVDVEFLFYIHNLFICHDTCGDLINLQFTVMKIVCIYNFLPVVKTGNTFFESALCVDVDCLYFYSQCVARKTNSILFCMFALVDYLLMYNFSRVRIVLWCIVQT